MVVTFSNSLFAQNSIQKPSCLKYYEVYMASIGGGLVLFGTEQAGPGDTEDSTKCF